MNDVWSWERAAQALPPILEGFRITLLATVVGTAIAAVLGLLVALVRRSPSRWVSAHLALVVDLVRSSALQEHQV